MVKSSDPQIGYLLKQAQAALRTSMDDVLRPLGLTVSQYSCLDFLARQPGISASALARGMFVTRQSMNAQIQTLVDRGWVARPTEATSGRARPAELTAAGIEMHRRAQDSVDGVQRLMVSGLSADEARELGRGLAACVSALESRLRDEGGGDIRA